MTVILAIHEKALEQSHEARTSGHRLDDVAEIWQTAQLRCTQDFGTKLTWLRRWVMSAFG
jgi:hypothetical protein